MPLALHGDTTGHSRFQPDNVAFRAQAWRSWAGQGACNGTYDLNSLRRLSLACCLVEMWIDRSVALLSDPSVECLHSLTHSPTRSLTATAPHALGLTITVPLVGATRQLGFVGYDITRTSISSTWPGSFHSEEGKQPHIFHVADGASSCPRRISLMLGATG